MLGAQQNCGLTDRDFEVTTGGAELGACNGVCNFALELVFEVLVGGEHGSADRQVAFRSVNAEDARAERRDDFALFCK